MRPAAEIPAANRTPLSALDGNGLPIPPGHSKDSLLRQLHASHGRRRDQWPLVCVCISSATHSAMLRISHSLTDSGQQWILCGQLAGPWVQEFRSSWEHSRRAAGSGEVVHLSDVTFIDEDGETLLSEMRSAGVRFVATGVDTRHLLENLKRRGERPLRRLIGCFTGTVDPCGSGAPKKRDPPCRSGGPSFDLPVEEDARLAGDLTNKEQK